MEKRSTWKVLWDLGVNVGLSAVLMVAGVHFARSRSYTYGIAGLVGGGVGLTRIRPGQVMMDLGRGADKDKNYEAAESYFAQAIRWNGPVDVYFYRAMMRSSKGDMEGAIADLDHHIHHGNCSNGVGCGAKGMFLYELKQYEQALEALEQALNISPYNSLFNQLAAQIHARFHRWPEAMTYLSRSLRSIFLYPERETDQEFKSKLLRCLNLRGLYGLYLGKVEESLEDHGQLIAYFPHLPSLYYNRAVATFHTQLLARAHSQASVSSDQLEMIDVESVVADLETTLQLRPNFVFAHMVLGNVLYWMGKEQQAFSVYEKAQQILAENPDMKLDEDDEHGWYSMILARYRLGDIEGARDDLERLQKLVSKYVDPLFPEQVKSLTDLVLRSEG